MDLDPLVHEPSRLAALTILRRTGGADYLFIRRLTGLSKGNLSNHLAKLEEAGLVGVSKHFEGKKPVSLTAKGKEIIEDYWSGMERVSARRRRESSDAAAAQAIAVFRSSSSGQAPGHENVVHHPMVFAGIPERVSVPAYGVSVRERPTT